MAQTSRTLRELGAANLYTEPTEPNDVATKAYVDSVAGGPPIPDGLIVTGTGTSIQGEPNLQFSQVTNQLKLSNGTSAEPSYSFLNSCGTGLSHTGSQEITEMTFGDHEQYQSTPASRTLLTITSSTTGDTITSVTVNGQELLSSAPPFTQTFTISGNSAQWQAGGGTGSALSSIVVITGSNPTTQRTVTRDALLVALQTSATVPPGGSGPFIFISNGPEAIDILAPLNLGSTPDGWVTSITGTGTLATAAPPLLLTPAGPADHLIIYDNLVVPNTYYVWFKPVGWTITPTDPTPAGITNISVPVQLISNTSPRVSVADPVAAAIDALAPFSAVAATISNLFAATVTITVDAQGQVQDSDASNLSNIGTDPNTSAGIGTLISTLSQGIDEQLCVSVEGTEVLSLSNTAGINARTLQIHNVVDPTSPQDAATKAYVDASGGGGSSVKGVHQQLKIQVDTTDGNYPSTGESAYWELSSTTVDYYIWYDFGGDDPNLTVGSLAGKTGIQVTQVEFWTPIDTAIALNTLSSGTIFNADITNTGDYTIVQNVVAGTPLSSVSSGNMGALALTAPTVYVTGVNGSGAAEITTITNMSSYVNAGTASYFTFDTPDTGYYVWYSSGGSATDPLVSGRTGIVVSTSISGTGVGNSAHQAGYFINEFSVANNTKVLARGGYGNNNGPYGSNLFDTLILQNADNGEAIDVDVTNMPGSPTVTVDTQGVSVITSGLSGNLLTISIENGSSEIIDLSPLNPQGTAVANAANTTGGELQAQLNALLASLRAAGLIAT